MGKHSRKQAPPDEDEDDGGKRKPYGYVLILRALASFAIRSGHDHAAALRVLCTVADYFDQDGKCRISQATIADRLGISRQAVNRQLAFLNSTDDLIAADLYGKGKLKTYVINTEHVEDEREGQSDIELGRAARRSERRARGRAAKGAETPKPNPLPDASMAAPSKDETRRTFQNGDVVVHPKFGRGVIANAEQGSDALWVQFDGSDGWRRVVKSFLTQS